MSVVLDPPHPEKFTICPTCHRLQGQVAGRRNDATRERVVLVQSCDCVGAEGRRPGPSPPRWPGYDFNEAWTLCYGCGAEVLASGSRWSVWFCEPCKAGVRRLPGGGPRALAGQPPPDTQAIARFVDAIGRLTGRMSHMAVWAARAVAMNLRRAGRDGPGGPLTLSVSALPATRGPAASLRGSRPPLRRASGPARTGGGDMAVLTVPPALDSEARL